VFSYKQGLDEENIIDLNFMKKQSQIRAYYDSFPNIMAAANQSQPNILAAKKVTDGILSREPSGDVIDKDILCHVLSKVLATKNTEFLFYNSEQGICLNDTSTYLNDIALDDKPFILTLKSSAGLGNIDYVKNEKDDQHLVQTLVKIIEQKQSHPILDELVKRLATAHNTNKENINIKTVYFGSISTVYTVDDLPSSIINSLQNLEPRLRDQFEQFVSLKIHPLLYRPAFDIAYFDERGDKSFSHLSGSLQVGPAGRTKSYTQPAGWTRFGLKVLDRYADGNKWLEPFGDPENWYRAFHGTGRAQRVDFGDNNQPNNSNLPFVDALASIHLGGFRRARTAVYGPGVYCSPNPKFPEGRYVQSATIDTRRGRKTFKCMLQVAVNPDGIEEHGDIWCVPDPQNIRAYGILIKECNRLLNSVLDPLMTFFS